MQKEHKPVCHQRRIARYIRRRVEIFLRGVWKGKYYKTWRNRYLERNEALVCYRTAEEAKTALADINMYQGWIAELYRSTSKDEQNRVSEGYREEQNKAAERRQQKERENTNTKEDNITSSKKK